jgi:hypothetical protein
MLSATDETPLGQKLMQFVRELGRGVLGHVMAAFD